MPFGLNVKYCGAKAQSFPNLSTRRDIYPPYPLTFLNWAIPIRFYDLQLLKLKLNIWGGHRNFTFLSNANSMIIGRWFKVKTMKMNDMIRPLFLLKKLSDRCTCYNFPSIICPSRVSKQFYSIKSFIQFKSFPSIYYFF